VRGPLLALIVAFLVLGADRSIATADTGPSDPQQQLAVIDQIRAQLGSNLADAMAAQQQLRQSLQDNAAQQQSLQGKIADVTGNQVIVNVGKVNGLCVGDNLQVERP